MPSDRRKGDIKVLVGATIAVLLLGGFIAGAAIVTTRGSNSMECGQLDIGSASDIRNNLDGGKISFQPGAFDFARLLSSLAFGHQNQLMPLR